ncbi:MAG TPA: lectin, partial [Actinoplanes sp.]
MQLFGVRSGKRRGARGTTARIALTVALTGTSGAAFILSGTGPASAAANMPIVGAGSSRCLDVPNASTANGTQLALFDCNGGANQRFTTTSTGQLQVMGKCVDAEGAAAAGARVILYDCTGGANQRWTFTSSGTITNGATGLCLDVLNAGTANGALIDVWTCNGQGNQRWTQTNSTPQPPPGTPPPTGGTCNVNPVDPAASPQARRLLCYLYSQYGNHIISGQQESTWVSGPDYEINYIRQHTGRYPAIRGMDRGDAPDFGSRALAWWNSGGIPMVGYHMGSPSQGSDGYDGSRMSANINAALTPGTADYGRLTQRLDGLAAQLQIVENGGGAVIFRPWHEAGGTWFWWSMEGGAQFNRLWRFTFDYLTRTKGLNNLVWMHPFNGSPQSSFYPGRAYVDVGGADTYAGDHGPLTSMFNTTRNIVGSQIPIALHENGRIPDPDQLQS